MFDERERERERITLIAMMPGRQIGHFTGFSHLLLEEKEGERVNELLEEKEEKTVKEEVREKKEKRGGAEKSRKGS